MTAQAEDTAELYERPSYRERANKRFVYVLAPCLAIAVVGVLTSRFSGWDAIRATSGNVYGAAIVAAVLTLLVAFIPGKPRRISRAGAGRAYAGARPVAAPPKSVVGLELHTDRHGDRDADGQVSEGKR